MPKRSLEAEAAAERYARALDGLVLVDPVAAFFDFCRERERIRRAREAGDPPPWTQDPVFQQGRFLNVFREDDRGTQALLRFARPVADDLEKLTHALFFARWCNKAATLDALTPELLEEPKRLAALLDAISDPPWCNVAAYPVESLLWEGRHVGRMETATTLFRSIRPFLVESLKNAGGCVTHATDTINRRLGMANDFPIFMAVMDLAWFRPDLIDPASHVPTGIGAKAFLDRLQVSLGLESHEATCKRMVDLQPSHWPEAKRPLQPIDIEYLSCECRKYFSYRLGTKTFTGKNVFTPGVSASLVFDIPEADVPAQTHTSDVFVLAGAPCSGKTTLAEALRKTGVSVVEETAERLLKEGLSEGVGADEMRADPVAWQEKLLAADFTLFERLAHSGTVFADTSFIETLVFSERAGLRVGPGVEAWLHRARYRRVFFLASLQTYAQSDVRTESQKLAEAIARDVRVCYERFGYEVVEIPDLPLSERVALVLSHAKLATRTG